MRKFHVRARYGREIVEVEADGWRLEMCGGLVFYVKEERPEGSVEKPWRDVRAYSHGAWLSVEEA